MSLKSIARKARLKANKTPSALIALDESLARGYGKISFDLLRDKADRFIAALEASDDGDHDRTEFFVSLADLFFSATLSYDGSGKTFLHPSSFMEECERKLFYDLTDTEYSNPPAPIEPSLQRIFDFGTIVHVYIQYHLWRAGVLTEAEAAAVRVDRRVHGKADGILVFERGGKEIMLEVKTANEFSYSKARRSPFKKHLNQATVYANSLGIDQILFVYVNKNTSEVTEHLVDVSPDITADTEYVMEKVITSVETNQIPDRSCKDPFTTEAQKCPYRDLCFKLKDHAETRKEESPRRRVRESTNDRRTRSLRKSRVRRNK